MSVTFTVPGEARPERKRQTGRPGAFYKRIDTPDARDYKATVKLCAAQAMAGREPLQGPLSLRATIFRLKPKSAAKRVTLPITRPDLDNYAKLLCDAITGIVFCDDAQIVDLAVCKRFGPIPSLMVEVAEVDNPEGMR